MPSRQFVTFDVANQFLGVPVETVQEILLNEKYTPMPLAPDECGGLFNLRGEVIGTVDLRVRFGLPPRSMSGSSVVNVVVLIDGEPVSLLVDRIGLVADLDDTAFELPPDTLTGPTREMIVGSYKTEDRLLLVLDVDKCVNTTRAAAA
jgi:purine-binding chemotaxis protein CheW